MDRLKRRPVSMEEAGRSCNNMPYRTNTPTLAITTRSYIVHLLSTYVFETIRRNCNPWITRPAGFASSLDM